MSKIKEHYHDEIEKGLRLQTPKKFTFYRFAAYIRKVLATLTTLTTFLLYTYLSVNYLSTLCSHL